MADSCAENAAKGTENERPKEVEASADTVPQVEEGVEEYLKRKNMVLLDYEKQMFLDLVEADGLLVCAK